MTLTKLFCIAFVVLIVGVIVADASITLSSVPLALHRRRQGSTPSQPPAVVSNAHRGAHICTPPTDFSINLVARDFPQFYNELGTWLGNITCYGATVWGTPGAAQLVDAPVSLNTTIYDGRLVSCSATAGGPATCRAFYPRFDGSGQYCTAEPADIETLGYPAFNQAQIINNGRVSVDTVWDSSQSLISGVFNYYEPSGNAISTMYTMWNTPAANGNSKPSALCFLHFTRTCRGTACFAPPTSFL